MLGLLGAPRRRPSPVIGHKLKNDMSLVAVDLPPRKDVWKARNGRAERPQRTSTSPRGAVTFWDVRSYSYRHPIIDSG
jgi:hypothetical protein